jgi:hypothetical protein
MYYDERHSDNIITIITLALSFHTRSLQSLVPLHFNTIISLGVGKISVSIHSVLHLPRVFLIIFNQNAVRLNFLGNIWEPTATWVYKGSGHLFFCMTTHSSLPDFTLHPNLSARFSHPCQWSFNQWVRQIFVFVFSFFNIALLDQCALRPDGSLKDASEISWVNDPDDEIVVASGSQLPGMYYLI